MASWKKVIVSGSKAVLAEVTASAGFSGDGSNLTGVQASGVDIDALSAVTTLHQTEDAFMVSDNGTEKKITFTNVEDAIFGNVSGDINIAAGGAATIQANSVALATDTVGDFVQNVTAGTGLTSTGATSGENIQHTLSVDAAQTQITSVGALGAGSISSGFGNIDNGTSTLNTGNATVDNFTNNSAVADTHITGSISGSFTGDGAGLTGVTAAVDIDSLDAVTSPHQTEDHFIMSDDGTEKKISFTSLEDAIFANVSGDINIAAGGAATIQANSVALATDTTGDYVQNITAGTGISSTGATSGENIAHTLNVDLSGLSSHTIGAASSTITMGDKVIITGNLEVRGSQTAVSSSNLVVADQFALFNSGSTSGDGGIVVQTGTAMGGAAVGTAYAYDDSAARWGFSEVDGTQHDATSFVPRQYVVSVSGSTVDPVEGSNPANFGASAATRVGMMHVNTTSGDVFIWS
tara:strand:- start:383 stop:1777 length:1395 start_codon:yes stop_codon:yes gene_type:complete